jgi:hypothetical protein
MFGCQPENGRSKAEALREALRKRLAEVLGTNLEDEIASEAPRSPFLSGAPSQANRSRLAGRGVQQAAILLYYESALT